MCNSFSILRIVSLKELKSEISTLFLTITFPPESIILFNILILSKCSDEFSSDIILPQLFLSGKFHLFTKLTVELYFSHKYSVRFKANFPKPPVIRYTPFFLSSIVDLPFSSILEYFFIHLFLFL